MTKKRLLIIGAVLSLIAVGIIIFISSPKQPPPGTIAPPSIPSRLRGEVNITSKFTEKDFNFPKSAPLLTVEKTSPLTENEALEIGQRFGYTSQADIAEDVFDGSTYLWSSVNDSLIVYSISRKVEYSLNDISPTSNKQLSDQAITDIASRFLSERGLAQDFEFSFFTFLKEASGGAEGINVTTKANALIYQVNFVPKGAGFKLLTLDPKASPIFVWVLPNGEVAKASVIKLGVITKTSSEYQLKNYNLVIDSIKEATVISLDDGNLNLPYLAGSDIKNIEITEIDLAYLLSSPQETTLQPVFTLKGQAQIEGFTSSVSAYLYLPAIKNPD